MQPNFFEHLEALLKTNKAYVAEDGRLLRNKVAEAAATRRPGVKTFVAVLDVARAMKTVVCATAATTTLMIIVTRRASAVDLVGATVVNSPPEATQCRVKTTL